MSERNEKLLLELLKLPENNVCADCGSKSKHFFLFVFFLIVFNTLQIILLLNVH